MSIILIGVIFIGGAIFNVFASDITNEQCGIQASENQYPWLAAIEYEYSDEPETKIHCTGALISKRHVVSSATCFDRDVYLGIAKFVRLGFYNSDSGKNCTGSDDGNVCRNNAIISVPIETVTIDPEYSSPSWESSADNLHDVALITLRDVVPYTDAIRPICLPGSDVTRSEVASGNLYLAGISDTVPKDYNIKQATMTYLDKAKCLELSYTTVAKDNICANISKSIDPCTVGFLINGGLLMNKNEKSFELVGLAISESGCNTPHARIKIFTHMFLYRNWLRSKTIEWSCGKRASDEHYPWLATIEFKYRDEPIQIPCSGALVSRRHVVCNAECFYRSTNPRLVKSVRLGPRNFITGITDDGGVRIPIKVVIQHPEFTRSFKVTGLHDIALAILRDMVTYTDVIRPICLPTIDVTSLDATEQNLYANVRFYEGPLSEIKRQSLMTYVDTEGCREVLNNYDMVLPEDLMCATNVENPSSCLGSSDLLINKRGDKYELVGLAQLSYCGTAKVFTNVFRSIDWIRNIIPEWTHGCGRRKVEHVELITSGLPTKAGDWPWHVALYRFNGTVKNYICGGTLISKKMVLTAAHCVTVRGESVDPRILSVVLGKYYLIGRDLQSREKDVASIIPHKDFAPTNYLHNDIALLRLATEAVYTDYIQPACIWSSDTQDSVAKDFGTVVGWGFDETNALSSQLKQSTAPIVSDVICIQKNPVFYIKVLNNNKKFCAGWANGTSPCNGDSGGGFFVFAPDTATTNSSNDLGSWYIRGIVSMTPAIRNFARCDPNQYVVFTDLANYTEWIEENLVQ